MEPNLSVTCPSCQTVIRLGKKPFVGFFFFCDECDAELEVMELHPLAVLEVEEE
jgi:lysine biosynthesis protein LysW